MTTTAPRLSATLVHEGAIQAGVCVRPIVRELIDTETGESSLVPIPCQSTLASACPPCADKARRLRMQQCREGWHLDTEPVRDDPANANDDEDQTNDDEDQADEDEPEPDKDQTRRVRSTRRRDDVPDLPRLPVENRTIGRTFTGPDGKTWRPSMFVTFTMPSYGRVNPDGTPIDPSTYDYRRAALDALHLSKLWDRLIQNLRRAVGYEVQYFAALEPQRRLAPHIHAAIRGAIPRKILRQVITATYASLWWPSHDREVYTTDHPPIWDERTGGYVNPDNGMPLPTWDQALDELDDQSAAAEPAHVIRFGRQTDMQGIVAGSPDADRRVGYLTKYLTKTIADPLDDEDDTSPARQAHIDRLHREVRRLPCSRRCWNWLAYGIQPKDAANGMRPGQCPAKGHDREHLGCGGRRVLVSRKWTGKTLRQHKGDRFSAVRTVLEAAGIDPEETGRCASTVVRDDGQPRYLWQPVDLEDLPTYAAVISRSITERNRWRAEYERAKQRAGPDPGANSATDHAA